MCEMREGEELGRGIKVSSGGIRGGGGRKGLIRMEGRKSQEELGGWVDVSGGSQKWSGRWKKSGLGRANNLQNQKQHK